MECCASGYGKVPITHIHGMTIGELGLFFYHRYLSNNTSTDSALFDLNLDLNMDLSTGDKSSKSSKSVAYSNYNTDGYENGGGYGYYIKRMDGYRRSDKWSDMMIHGYRHPPTYQHQPLPWPIHRHVSWKQPQ